MKRRILASFLSLLLAVSFSACGSTETQSNTTAQSIPSTQQEVTVAETTQVTTEATLPPAVSLSDSGSLGNYEVQIHDFELCKDYSGSPAILVSFTFSNHSEENASAIFALSYTAYQNGVQLDSAIISDSSVYNSNDLMKELQPDASIDLKAAFVLLSETAPVEFEVSETFSMTGEQLGKNFDITDGGVTELSTAPVGEKVDTIGDYAVSVVSQELTKDYEGKNAILIHLGYTNNSDRTDSFLSSLDVTAFQDGVELESAILTAGDTGSSQLRKIKPGAGISVSVAYLLSSDTSPVELKIGELFSMNSDSVTYTVNIP